MGRFNTKKKKQTDSQKRYLVDVSKHHRINMEKRFAVLTGLCPICRAYPTGHGITCGNTACVKEWLIPKSQQRIKLIVENIEQLGGDNTPPPAKGEHRKMTTQAKPINKGNPPDNGENSPYKRPASPFTAQRRKALESVDNLPWDQAKPIIEKFYRDYGTPLPPTDDALLTAVHQQRVNLSAVYPEMAKVSRQWLQEKGYLG